jgi:putative ABC transport system ATP-binding protein
VDRALVTPAHVSRVISAPAEPAVCLRGVTKRYRVGEAVVTALAEVDLAIAPGEFVVVLGPSGCGKTTLLNVIGALDLPTAGSVTIAGRCLDGAARRDLFRFRREVVSFVFQTFNLFPGLTALENVEFGADVAGRPDAEQVAVDVLRQVGLGERMRHFPQALSGGEQQRVAIARALASGRPILLADEPTGELDFRTGVQILELLRARADTEHIVVLVTHNREVARIADRVLELSGGRVVSDGPPVGGRIPVAELRW